MSAGARHGRFDRERLAKLLAQGWARSEAEDDAERLLDTVEHVVRKSQPNAVGAP
jgi:hypothetical protein